MAEREMTFTRPFPHKDNHPGRDVKSRDRYWLG